MKFSFYWTIRSQPKRVRDDLRKLFGCVNTIRELTQQGKSGVATFERIEQRWQTAKTELARKQVPPPLERSAHEHVVAQLAYLTHRHSFDPAWVDAFLKSMRWDLQKHEYRSLKDLGEYMFGSAEVIGLMAAHIMGLPEDVMKAVRYQSRALQYMSFLRGIVAQNKRGFGYFPLNDLKKYGLKSLKESEVRRKKGMYTDFIHAELLRYALWQAKANEGFAHVPKRLRAPLEAIVDMNNQMAQQLKYNPFLPYEKPLKPKRRQFFRGTIRHTLSS